MPTFEQATFKVERNTGGDLCIMWSGIEDYAGLLIAAFPKARFSSIFPDKFGKYRFGIYAKRVTQECEPTIRDFCDILNSAVWIRDGLDYSFSVSMHKYYARGTYSWTQMGELVHQAKPYSKPVQADNIIAANALAEHIAEFIEKCPMYLSASVIAAVPPYGPKKTFDLPTYIVSEVAKLTKKMDVSYAIRKIRDTKPMKDCNTDAERLSNIRNAFQADSQVVAGKVVILLDDIYDSGRSINEVGRTIRSAGASSILGLTATKTQT